MKFTADIKIKDIDPTVLDRLKEASSMRAVAGIPADAPTYPDGTSMQDVAIYNEFGTSRIPERSFLRSTMEERQDEYVDLLVKGIEQFVEKGKPLEDTLELAGLKAAGDIQQKITDLSDPPNSPLTIALKGSSNPLINTGAMRAAVTHEVREGDSDE